MRSTSAECCPAAAHTARCGLCGGRLGLAALPAAAVPGGSDLCTGSWSALQRTHCSQLHPGERAGRRQALLHAGAACRCDAAGELRAHQGASAVRPVLGHPSAAAVAGRCAAAAGAVMGRREGSRVPVVATSCWGCRDTREGLRPTTAAASRRKPYGASSWFTVGPARMGCALPPGSLGPRGTPGQSAGRRFPTGGAQHQQGASQLHVQVQRVDVGRRQRQPGLCEDQHSLWRHRLAQVLQEAHIELGTQPAAQAGAAQPGACLGGITPSPQRQRDGPPAQPVEALLGQQRLIPGRAEEHARGLPSHRPAASCQTAVWMQGVLGVLRARVCKLLMGLSCLDGLLQSDEGVVQATGPHAQAGGLAGQR